MAFGRPQIRPKERMIGEDDRWCEDSPCVIEMECMTWRENISCADLNPQWFDDSDDAEEGMLKEAGLRCRRLVCVRLTTRVAFSPTFVLRNVGQNFPAQSGGSGREGQEERQGRLICN